MKNMHKTIKDFLWKIYIKLRDLPGLRNLPWFRDFPCFNDTNRLLSIRRDRAKKVFYFGITEHSNLGDMAQCYCIRQWIQKHLSDYHKYEFSVNTVVDSRFNFIKKLGRCLSPDDIIVFQSGYTTQDLGGYHDLMHRLVIDAFPWAKIIMMPQTVFFKSPERKALSSKVYNQAENMLFLARDRVSYGMALEMFPDIAVRQFPDIVTTLIGTYRFNFSRSGVLLCCRGDLEKLYSDADIDLLRQRLGKIQKTDRSDTTLKVGFEEIQKDIKGFIDKEVSSYAHYKLIITDRYHGTIFALAANTPVIVLKTTDHKVATGTEWFKGIYDEYVYLAQDLDDAYEKAVEMLGKEFKYELESYFEKEYYDKIPSLWRSVIGEMNVHM